MPRRLMSREARAEILELKRREGLSFPELARRTRISVGTLRVWAQRARRRKSVLARRARFVELDVRTAPVSEGFEIVAVAGRLVRVRAGFDADELGTRSFGESGRWLGRGGPGGGFMVAKFVASVRRMPWRMSGLLCLLVIIPFLAVRLRRAEGGTFFELGSNNPSIFFPSNDPSSVEVSSRMPYSGYMNSSYTVSNRTPSRAMRSTPMMDRNRRLS